jgi:hypothetical protein
MLWTTPVLAAAADPGTAAVVLASTAPGYMTGQVLTGGMVEVPDGASTVFLLSSGQAITIKGPYAGSLASRKPVAKRDSLAQLLAPGQDRSQIGGARSLGEARPGGRLILDPAQGGSFCLAPDTEVALARPADPAFDTVELRQAGRVVTLRWPEPDQMLPWPPELPLAQGAAVTVRSARTGATRRLEFRSMGGAAGLSDTAHAAALALAGCSRQAEAALGRLRDAMVPLDLYLASDHGRYPVYRAGEPVRLMVQVNRDAYLYCMVRDTAGRMLPLFPPLPGQARVESRRALSLPGPVGGDASEIRCMASERDLAADLPQLARPALAEPLSEETITALDRAIADPRQGRIVMAQLILRVEE